MKILGTGNCDLIGDIAPNESKSMVVNIAGEGHLEFEYEDPVGELHHLGIDCYLEYYHRAAVFVSINGDEFERVKEEKAFWRHPISIDEIPRDTKPSVR
ncbi:hypothetical protein K2Y11_04035 [bacterium]|nr:hypothetical protein [bacterium]